MPQQVCTECTQTKNESNHDNPEYINKIMIEYLPECKHSIKRQPLLLELNNILKINVVM